MKRAIETFAVAVALTVLPLVATDAANVDAPDKGALAEANKFVERGNKFIESGSLPRAKLEYQKALKLYPKHLDALYNLGVVCDRLGLKGEAIDQYKRYVELKPDEADAWTQLALLYDDTGNKKQARIAYEKA